MNSPADRPFDAIVIGTGFGGAVVACRLAQAGLHICVLERGRRYESSEPVPGQEPESDFPQLPASDRVAPDFARWAWSGDQGLWDVVDAGGAQIVQAAGYGGGSLICANVHLRAPTDVFMHASWPAGYDAAALGDYYDRAAGMLDIKPITAAPFSLIKTDQLKKAADALERGADFFHPPLAVSFENRKNAFGKAQGACRACGECDTGCRYRAKNTLDLNYLAVVDAAPNAEVRTLAEALLITELGERAKDGYEVEYRDHLQGRETLRVRARHVFVCAGAVGSTALLLDSKRAASQQADKNQPKRGLPRLDASGQLGRNYFLNADALGIVYDARLAPDANGEARARVLKPTMGPVITGAIVHRDEVANTWLLLQDGGFPKAFARHVGLMRAPLMLRRNRYERRSTEDTHGNAIPVIAPTYPNDLPHKLPAPVEPLPIGDAGGIPGGPLTSQVDGLLRLAQVGELAKTIPSDVKSAVSALREEFDPLRIEEMNEISKGTRDRLADASARSLARICTLCLTNEPPTLLLRVIGPMLRWAYRKAAPSEQIAQATEQTMIARYGLDNPMTIARKVSRFLLGFDDDHKAHSEHAMVLLAMGRDDAPAVLRRNADDALELELALKPAAPVYSQQERLMRDLAATLNGKLRVNPAWAFGRKPITVHGQGGCRMADDEDSGVTDAHGMVFGHPGLFVLDGAILPTSVGVNPSATIAAVAERNIEWFLEQQKGELPEPAWATLDAEQTTAWKARAKAWTLTPPRGTGLSAVSQPLGVEFDEEMSGYLAPVPEPDPEDDDAYEAAEIAGRPDRSVSVALTVQVQDIAQFTSDMQHTATVTGEASVVTPELSGMFAIEGTLRLFPISLNQAVGRMEYALRLLEKPAPKGAPGAQPKVIAKLDGYKRVRDDSGPDVWRDTTTLFATLTPQHGAAPASHGVLHVAMNRFLTAELPSFRVLGTDDPARIVWALSAFNAYFFKSVQRVYVPQLNKAVDLLDSIGLR